VKKKTSNAPVFLIYAGVIHAVGLALLMPMLITLPGPGSLVVPQPSAIDVEIVPASPAQANIEQDNGQTSALPSPPPPDARDAVGEEGEAVANVSPEAEAPAESEAVLQQDEPAEVDPRAEEVKRGSTVAAPAKAKSRAAKKPVAKRSRTAKPAVRRPAKTQTKIAPFNGALTGLFSPGAPANRRR
jgi:hypothetical protein